VTREDQDIQHIEKIDQVTVSIVCVCVCVYHFSVLCVETSQITNLKVLA